MQGLRLCDYEWNKGQNFCKKNSFQQMINIPPRLLRKSYCLSLICVEMINILSGPPCSSPTAKNPLWNPGLLRRMLRHRRTAFLACVKYKDQLRINSARWTSGLMCGFDWFMRARGGGGDGGRKRKKEKNRKEIIGNLQPQHWWCKCKTTCCFFYG